MKRFPAFCIPALLLTLCILASACLAYAQPESTPPTALAADPFYVRHSWLIGGDGAWDSLAIDPIALQLFIAHGPVIQVVDIETGALINQIPVEDSVTLDNGRAGSPGTNEAHSIALDDSGQFGYVSVGKNGNLQVFDRRLFRIVASVRTGPNPRAIVFEPLSRLVFVICDPPEPAPVVPAVIPPWARQRGVNPPPNERPRSQITVIETEKWTRLGDIHVTGRLGVAQADGKGQIFVTVSDPNEILSFDAQAVQTELREIPEDKHSLQTLPPPANPPAKPANPNSLPVIVTPPKPQPADTPAIPTLDWLSRSSQQSGAHPAYFRLPSSFTQATGLAVDSSNERLFVACANAKMAVLNSSTGAAITSLDITGGQDSVAYDPNHNLIFAASGANYGSLTVIRQHVTDTYEVTQNLPTQQRATTLAVNPVTGNVYLVTDMIGIDLSKKGSIRKPETPPTVLAAPIKGSFQVLVVGH